MFATGLDSRSAQSVTIKCVMAFLMSIGMNAEGVHRRLDCIKLESILFTHSSYDIHVIKEF